MEKMHPKILTRRPNFLTHGIKNFSIVGDGIAGR